MGSDDRRQQRDRVMAAVAAVMVLVGAAAVWFAPAEALGPVRPPVIPLDTPDPSLASDGGVFYLYATNAVRGSAFVNVPVSSSTDLTTWTDVGDALPQLGSWADEGWTWAPSARRVGSTSWVLYYAAHDRASGRQCIGVATASTARGPFVDRRAGPLVCQLDRGGSIDPEAFTDTDGTKWLVWKSDDNSIGGVSVIWSQRLSSDGLSLTGSATALLIQDQVWEWPVVEAPSMGRANGRLYLFYSASWWESASYAIGYAGCSSPAGPCRKVTVDGPWMSQSTAAAVGPGGESMFVTPGGATVMAFHSWQGAIGYDNGGRRAASIEPMAFSTGSPNWRPDLPRLHSQFLRDTASGGFADRTSVLDAPSSGRLLMCDWDGDGVATPATFVDGVWYATNAPTGPPSYAFGYGDPGDIPVCGDWDGNGTQTQGVVRNGVWYLSNVAGQPVASMAFGYGNAGDLPVVGDWDGNRTETPGVTRGGTWYLSDGFGVANRVFRYGNPGDIPIAGRWTSSAGGIGIGVTR